MSDQNDEATVILGADPSDGGSKGGQGGGNGISEAPVARLVCIDPSQIEGSPADVVVELRSGETQTIGRGDASTFVIASHKLSRQHARLFPGVGAWGVEDMNSTNGVFVNGLKIRSSWLRHGDEVRLGPLAFRYELEQPVAQAEPARAMALAEPQDDDSSDRTMMVGSLGAGRAVLEAARQVDAPPKLTVQERDEESEAVPPPPKGKGLVRIAAVLVVLGALGAGGAFLLPMLGQGKDVAAAIERSAVIRKRVIEKAQQYTSSAQAITFEQDLTDLAGALADSGRFLQSEPNAKLADTAARLRFPSFEREFLPVFGRNDIVALQAMTDALAADIETITRQAGPAPNPADTDGLAAARDLARLADILLDFRAFALEFPQVSKLAPTLPTRERIQELDGPKADFIRIRRQSNRFLSVDYLLFNSVVKTVEERDMVLVNQWKEFLGGKSG